MGAPGASAEAAADASAWRSGGSRRDADVVVTSWRDPEYLHADMATIRSPSGTQSANPRDTTEMGPDERFAVLRSIGEECIYEDGLCLMLKKKLDPICYVWFEPSPIMDIEQGILKMIYVNKMVKAGCTVKILMADWFLQRHPRIGNDLNKIQVIGCYNIAMWKAAGMYLDRVDIKWLSDELNHRALDYWPLAMDVSRKYTINRMARQMYGYSAWISETSSC